MIKQRVVLPGGLDCAALGFGTMGIGGKFQRDDSRDGDATNIIHLALDLGINLFDTAEIYGAGHSEEVLGAALKGRRHQAVIATKFNPGHSGKAAMIMACEDSLRRLQSDVIDLYQTHWPDPATPLADMAAGFIHLVASGKVRAIGFSNAPSALMQKILALLPDGFPVAAVQQEYNLAERFVERAVLPFCQSRRLGLLAYSPFGQGKLMAHPGLGAIAARYDTTPAALSLHWLIRTGSVIPIPMTLNTAHLRGNVTALNTALPADALDEADILLRPDLRELDVTAITVTGSLNGKAYFTLDDARANNLQLSPSPAELAEELRDGEMLKPVKARVAGDGRYELYEGQLRYWAWRLAHDDAKPIPTLVTA